MKVTYAKRLPPGDRWQIGNEIFESLTECLNEIFIREQVTYFEIDARLGEIFIDDGKEAPKAPPKVAPAVKPIPVLKPICPTFILSIAPTSKSIS